MDDKEYTRLSSGVYNVLGNKKVKVYTGGVLIAEFQIPVLRHTTNVTFHDGKTGKSRITRYAVKAQGRVGWRWCLEGHGGIVYEAGTMGGANGDVWVAPTGVTPGGGLTLRVNRDLGVDLMTERGKLVGELKAASWHTHRLRLENEALRNCTDTETERNYLLILLMFVFCQYPDRITLPGTGLSGNTTVGLLGAHAILGTTAAVF